MRHARSILALALVVVLLGSGLAIPASQALVKGDVPDEWQGIEAQIAKLVAADGASEDSFGNSVSVDGDVAIAGAPLADGNGGLNQGAAYVFYRDQGGADAWGQVAKLTAVDGSASDFFGYSVSVDGDTAVAGAYGADLGGNAGQGAVYVFYRDQGGADAWGQVAKLTATDGVAGDEFGWSVSVDGDTAVVGAPVAWIGGSPIQGAAYVFYRDQGGADAWGQVAKLTAADGAEWDQFGNTVSVSDDKVLVGAFQANAGGNEDQGAAYVFYRDQGGADAWGQVAKLTAGDGAAYDSFGQVSLSDDIAVIGARLADVGGNPDQGAAYVFYRDQGGPDAWGQVAKLASADGASGDYLGSASVSGSTAVVGAYRADIGGNEYQGASYVFCRDQGGPDAWGQTAKLTAGDGAMWDSFGGSVSVSSDTVVVGAWQADVGGHDEQGAAYVFYEYAMASLHLGNVQGWLSLDPYGRHLLLARVTVHDQSHNPAGEVEVDASIWSPAGGPFARTRVTKPASGTARFSWGSKESGNWQFCVDDLTKAGFTYVPDLNDVPECAGWSN